MRKVLLATTALVGVAFAGAAHAASTSPISLNVGGYTDFVAGIWHEAQGTTAAPRASRDFETEYKINFDAVGKGSNGIEYGANVSLWNGPEVTNAGAPWTGGGTAATINSAYVWLSGAFGKVMLGDEHGATDLFVYAPTVGEGQVDGRYMDFVDPTTLDRFYASGVDNTEHSTKITYYTPKVGNDMNKVQLGVSYAPNLYNYGQAVTKYNTGAAGVGATSPYQDVIDGAVEYWGNFHPVTVALSADITTGSAGAAGAGAGAGSAGLYPTAPGVAGFSDYTTFGLGGQVGFSGFTVGASYVDMGRYGAVHGQNKSQDVWTFGGKYEFDKVGVAVSYLTGEGYDNLLNAGFSATTTNTNYVSSFNAWGVGAVYTWFPGLTTNADGVLFQQGVSNEIDTNNGYVLLVSQRLAF